MQKCNSAASSEESRIVLLTDKGKKDLASLFSEKDIKFVLYGKLIGLCMRNQQRCPVFSGLKYSQAAANAKVLNLTSARVMGGNWTSRAFLGMSSYDYWPRFFAWVSGESTSTLQNALLHPDDCPPYESAGIKWRFDASSLPPALKDLNPQKTIILNPYAQSADCGIALFELIAERAAQAGYTALCHVHWGQKGLKACGNIACTLKEIGTFLASGAALVALRSGFVDVMLHTGCKIVSLLPDDKPSDWRLDSGGIKSRINPNVADVVINAGDYSATADEALLRLAELEQKERARCSST